MSRVLQSSIRAGENTVRSAERLLDAGTPHVNLPRYVRELSDAAKFVRGPGDPNLYEEAVKRWQSQIERLGQGRAGGPGDYTIKSATEQLIIDLRNAKPEQIDRIVNRWVLDRARYQARVVARNEAVEAHRDVSVEGWKQQPWVHGVRWTLSGNHPKQDICDLHASVNRYGLGPGGYPLESIPRHHTSCICFMVPLADKDYLKRETAKLRGEPEPPKPWLQGEPETAEQWLLKQSADTQTAIVGPTRARLLKQGERIYVPGASNFRKVHNLLGKPKPKINYGPRVDATKLVDKDRGTMVTPFPDLPGIGKVTRPKPPAPPPPPPASPPAAPVASPPSAPVAVPAPVAAPAPVMAPDVLSKAPAADQMRAEYLRRWLDSVAGMRSASQGQYVGKVSPGMLDHARRVQADAAAHFGLTIRNHVTQLEAMTAEAGRIRNGRYTAGSFRPSTGVMTLRIDDMIDVQHHTVVHESIHTLGGVATTAYRGMGLVLEEVVTEELSQAYLGGLPVLVSRSVLPVDVSSPEKAFTAWLVAPARYKLTGSYESWRQKAHSMVAAATGDDSAENVARTLRNAGIRWKRGAYTDEQQAADAFVEALEPKTSEQRAFYSNALHRHELWGRR